MSIRGADEVRKRIETLITKVPNEVGNALYQEALIIQKVSMERTPVDFGVLRADHQTERPVYSGRDITVDIVVGGGPSETYALFVHENQNAFHKVGRSKFLESAVLEAVPTLAARVAARIDLNRASR